MKDWDCRKIITLVAPLICALGVLLVNTGCASTKGGDDLRALGLRYRLEEIKKPRPNRVHILRVDLANRRIRPAVVVVADPDGDGPAEAALTDPMKLADDPAVLAFVNANPWDSFPDAKGQRNRRWFEGQPVDIIGMAVSGSEERSPSKPSAVSVWIKEPGYAFLGDSLQDRPVADGTAGFQRIVTDGAVIVSPSANRAPRTAIGVNRAGSVMWLVVVDGRQEHYSEGMDLYELAQVMRDLGCWKATNMDGGGSSIMGLTGADRRLRVMNSPSDRRLGITRIRPLPVILTIRERPQN